MSKKQFYRKGVGLLLLCISSLISYGQSLDFVKEIPHQLFQEVHYGQAEKQVFDLFLPPSDKPVPLVIFIHGGGFLGGDKKEAYKARKEDIRAFLKQGIAFATINYRFRKNNDSMGVNTCLADMQHALQYLRFHAAEYGIDTKKIAGYGTSAGAGGSLLLAFHNDMALQGDTSYLGQSTRISCAAAISTQATYNIPRWRKYIPYLWLIQLIKQKELNNSLANFYGYPNYEAFKPIAKQCTQAVDILSMITPDDPPIYVINLQKQRFPSSLDIIFHHRKHALILDKYFTNNQIEHHTYTYIHKMHHETDAPLSVKAFLIQQLRK